MDLAGKLDEILQRLDAMEERVQTAVAEARRDMGPSNPEIEQRLLTVEDHVRHLRRQADQKLSHEDRVRRFWREAERLHEPEKRG